MLHSMRIASGKKVIESISFWPILMEKVEEHLQRLLVSVVENVVMAI